MIEKRTVALFLLSALFGYGIHDIVNNGLIKLLNRTQIISNKSSQHSVLGQSSADQFMVKLTYNGSKFEPDYISMKAGNYLVITNKSKTDLMWVASNLPGLSTSRGYAEGEQFQFMVKTTGTFLIRDGVKSNATVTLQVRQ